MDAQELQKKQQMQAVEWLIKRLVPVIGSLVKQVFAEEISKLTPAERQRFFGGGR